MARLIPILRQRGAAARTFGNETCRLLALISFIKMVRGVSLGMFNTKAAGLQLKPLKVLSPVCFCRGLMVLHGNVSVRRHSQPTFAGYPTP